MTNRRRLAVAGVLLLTALSSATVFIDGWWLYVAGPTHHGAIPDPGMAGRLALAGSALVSRMGRQSQFFRYQWLAALARPFRLGARA